VAPEAGADAAAVPEAPTPEQPAPEGTGPAATSELSNESATTPQDDDALAAEKAGEIDPDLLAADPAPRSTPPPPTLRSPPSPVDPESEQAALRAEFERQHRPASNPGRINIVARAMFANAGGKNRVGGRMGGAQVDVGQSWNSFGYAVTGSMWGGSILLPRETGAEMNALMGAGPTLSLGRRALIERGYLDLRLGYDFLYGVVNERRTGPTIVATPSDSNVVLTQTDNLAPHGPRVSLNMGFFSLNSTYRRFVHGFGVTAGYQGLVGSFRGELPFTHMLTLGLSYWMG
jgi:hypothetical protein